MVVMFRLIRVKTICATLAVSVAMLQSATAQFGDGFGLQQPKRHHTGFNGQPCLTLKGFVKAQDANEFASTPPATASDIYEHWVRATNSCGENVKVKVCYHDSDHCITMNVPAWGQSQSILGIFPALTEFRFDATEQF